MRSQSIEPHTHISSILSDDTSKGHLFIGSVICLLKPDILSKHDITAILTCSGETFQPGPKTDQMRNTISSLGIHHKLVSASDTENYQIIQHFQDCSEFIRQHRDQGRNVLVHCHAGKSRSASIVIAYLMEEL
jgi:dual specificity phosphatase 12